MRDELTINASEQVLSTSRKLCSIKVRLLHDLVIKYILDHLDSVAESTFQTFLATDFLKGHSHLIVKEHPQGTHRIACH